MPSFAEKLFDFTQRRQAMALDQERFAEAKRQFNLGNELSNIQTQQNSRRLDLLAEAQKASERGQREAHEIQRQGIEINKKATEATIENYKFNQRLAEFGILQRGEGLRGESGELIPVDQSILESERFQRAQEQQIKTLQSLDTFVKQQYPGLNEDERASIVTRSSQLLQQSHVPDNSGIKAATGKLFLDAEAENVIGQAQALAGDKWDTASSGDINKYVGDVINSLGPEIDQKLSGISSNPRATLRARAINSIISTRVYNKLREAQAAKAGQNDLETILRLKQAFDSVNAEPTVKP